MRVIKSVKFAVAGLQIFFTTENNGRIQGVIALAVIIAGFFFSITRADWIIILGCIALVLCLEMVNSAIEKLCNRITTDIDPAIKAIKDISAGAVLLASIISAAIGVIVFYPYVVLEF